MLDVSHHVPGCRCLGCDELIDATSALEGEDAPSPGDITICIYCGHIMAFDDQGGLRELNDEEAYKIAGDRRIVAIQNARAKLKAADGK